MKHEKDFCELCGKLLSEDGRRINRRNGLLVTVGYSIGGWGSRQNAIDYSRDDLCDECFSAIKVAMLATWETIRQELRTPQKTSVDFSKMPQPSAVNQD